MTDDQMWRAAITGASTGVLALLFQKLKTYLRARRDESGRGLAERFSYGAGKLWAAAHKRAKHSLSGGRV
jgi:hypothetical protein